MGPEWWLVAGIVGAVALLAAGYAAGVASVNDQLARVEAEREQLAGRIAELLSQGEAGVRAAAMVLEAERAVSAARGLSARERLLLLSRAGGGAGGTASGGSAAGGGPAAGGVDQGPAAVAGAGGEPGEPSG